MVGAVPLLGFDDTEGGRGPAQRVQQVFLRYFIDAKCRGQNTGTRLRDAQPLQQALNGTIFAARPVQG